MVKRLIKNGPAILTRRQSSILTAAAVIMLMIAVSRTLGLVRNRVLAHFFSAETLSLYFAAFRLPELIFEILVLGTLSSAFIPTFTAYLSRKKKSEAWYVASATMNLAMLIFTSLALLIFIFGRPLYKLVAAGFTPEETGQIVTLSRILLLTQGFFVLSYFVTGVLESMQRFLIPAVAPLFYNLGIIAGAVLLSSHFGIYAPAIGAVFGAMGHLLIQLPVARYLGFRFRRGLDFSHPGVKRIGRLALPRIIELSFLQVGKTVELFLASLISTAAYTHFTFANSLQLLPVGLFGVSLAKAALPTLSRQAVKKNFQDYQTTFLSSFNEIVFLVVPCAVFLAVLRIPLVRIAFGSARFDWASTVQTGYTLSAFCLGISFQALLYLLNRAFYALHESVTPVKVSIAAILLNILISFVFTLGLRWPIWSLALSFSLTSVAQFLILLILLARRIKGLPGKRLSLAFMKVSVASGLAGGVMFLLLKLMDRSVWDKRLSFLGRFGINLPKNIDHWLVDTRYTVNLIFLTVLVAVVGGLVYLLIAWLLKVEEISVFSKIFWRLGWGKSQKALGLPVSSNKKEAITVTTEKS